MAVVEVAKNSLIGHHFAAFHYLRPLLRSDLK